MSDNSGKVWNIRNQDIADLIRSKYSFLSDGESWYMVVGGSRLVKYEKKIRQLFREKIKMKAEIQDLKSKNFQLELELEFLTQDFDLTTSSRTVTPL